MNRTQALIYLSTVCICEPKTCVLIGPASDAYPICRACNSFRNDPELSSRTSCVARTTVYRRVRSGYYNGARAAWEGEKELTDRERVAIARSGFYVVAPENDR